MDQIVKGAIIFGALSAIGVGSICYGFSRDLYVAAGAVMIAFPFLTYVFVKI
ncbi:hypothetical protein UFOVP1157_51 [uncultured Caudovirales phage]|uniref:Uncharacterized protein n=1 Tax=uncultured Caudovirales phage TaxID=2100421 RepID=A0A6J5PYC5_9CAUD|nr:hypothetical protein UFOVP497_44 [uncultured Caudovirales phage]CAB4164344.1 hypothetical protein UFOVP834_20 [uncultured Caudovirales phage]CAB4172394.1 hypothetical protein UFOVP922_51 [uncultured Caudovirales phage]CAB4177744.1 hypothetical protein UFOVP1006_44 [uncultured Caudovirales phage]CAB4184045.1 hypothetical protein UFOVP1096_36 [uncultured Caudovirales phage]